MLESCDVGHRVVVRRRLGPGPLGRPQLSDLLGELVEIGADRLVVRGDDGTPHTVARPDVVAAKRIPPRPARFSEIIALERLADAAWPAPVRERLGDWILRAAQGFTNRANSALPLGDAGLSVGEAVDACTVWYRRHDLTPRITVPLPLRRDVATLLTNRGWYAQPLVLVQTAQVSGVLADQPTERTKLDRPTGTVPDQPTERTKLDRPTGTEPDQPTGRTDLLESPSPDFLRIIAARKRGLPPSAHHLLSAVPNVRFIEIRGQEDATVLAIARGAVIDGWLHVGLVEVVEAARRRGLARHATRALAGWAAGIGATRALLQVEEQNVAAVALYGRMGFHTHHRYVTFALR